MGEPAPGLRVARLLPLSSTPKLDYSFLLVERGRLSQWICGLLLAYLGDVSQARAGDEVVPGGESVDWLEWTAAPECPTKSDIEAKVAGWLGDPFVPEHALDVAARATFQDGRWEVVVALTYNEKGGSRRVAVNTCSEAADFVAVSVALAIEPSFSPPDRDSVVGDATTDASAPEETEGEEPNGSDPTSETTGSPAEGAPPASSRTRSLRGEIGAATLLSAPPFPRARWGFHVWGGLSARGWLAQIGFAGLPPFEYQSDAALHPVRFSLWYTQLHACRDFLPGAVGLALCAGAQLGSIQGRERTPGAGLGGSSLWTAASLGGQLRVPLGRVSWFYLAPDFLIPVNSPTFVLSGENEPILYVPGPGLHAAAGFLVSY